MANVDWQQFITIAVIFAGIYLIFEVIRILVMKTIRVDDDRTQKSQVLSATKLFSILRLVIIALFLISMVFTATFNRQVSNTPRQQLGHDLNIEETNNIEREELQKSIEEKQRKYQEKSLEEVNRESEESYDKFMEKESGEGKEN